MTTPLPRLSFGPDEKPPYAFCESIHASGTSPWHIRKIAETGLKLTGGIDTPFLCGRVTKGWDLNVRITPHHLTHCCKGCVKAYEALGLVF